MKSKYMGLIFSIGMVISALSPLTFNSTTAGPVVWLEDGMTWVFQDDPVKSNPSITLYSAKNEYEPFQIVVRAPAGNDLTNVNVLMSDFTGSGYAQISADNITLYREHYVQVTQGSDFKDGTNNPLGPGWYPDALIPFEDPDTHQDLTGRFDAVPFDLPSGQNQPIWADVYVPPEALSGEYQATATVSSDQGSASLQIHLSVWNFTLPEKRSLGAFTHVFDPYNSLATQIDLLKHRFNPKYVPREDERFLIDHYGFDIANVYDWSHASYRHCEIDPPPSVADVQESVANHQPELYLYTAYANEVWPCTDIYPELMTWANNLRMGGAHPVLVMYPIDELMGPDLDHTAADIWVVLPKHFDQAKENIDKLIAHEGTEVWSYNPINQDDFSPKLVIDFLPINSRIMHGFINQSLGLTGSKIWRVDYWTSDPWTDVDSLRLDAPGDGAMVYPGDDVGLPGQVVSGMRMKWFREGSEDYEYIQILKNLGQGDFAMPVVRGVGLDFHTWTQDKDVLYAARKTLGDRIDLVSFYPKVYLPVAYR